MWAALILIGGFVAAVVYICYHATVSHCPRCHRVLDRVDGTHLFCSKCGKVYWS